MDFKKIIIGIAALNLIYFIVPKKFSKDITIGEIKTERIGENIKFEIETVFNNPVSFYHMPFYRVEIKIGDRVIDDYFIEVEYALSASKHLFYLNKKDVFQSDKDLNILCTIKLPFGYKDSNIMNNSKLFIVKIK